MRIGLCHGVVTSASATLMNAQSAGPGRLLTPVLSPDSALVAYAQETSSRTMGDIWVTGTRAGARPMRVASGMAPSWSPDGGQLAFQGLDSSRQLQIFVWNRAHRSVRQITRLARGIEPNFYINVLPGTEAARLSWSPDGRKILFASIIADPRVAPADDTTPMVLTERSPPAKVWAGIMRYTFGGWRYIHGVPSGEMLPDSVAIHLTNEVVQLCIADIATGDVVQLTRDSAGAFDAAWSPDGTTIVYESNEGEPMMASRLRATNLYTMRADGTNRVAVTSGDGRKYFPVWSANSRTVAFETKPSGAYVTQGTTLVDIATRAVVTDSARVHAAIARDFPITVRTGVLATPGNVRLELRLSSAPSRVLVDISPPSTPVLATTRSDTVQRITWTGARGARMTGRLRLPRGYRAGTRYPLVVDAYAEWETPDTLTAAGYVVFSPSPRSPIAPGNAEYAPAYRRLAIDSPAVALRVLLEDVMSGVDTLVQRGLADSTRMALVGFSNGAGVVNYLVTLTDRFKCGVAQSPSAGDLTSMFFTDPDGEYLLTFFNGNAPWDKPELYSMLSSVNFVNRVRVPMLYAIGDKEGFVFASGALEMYAGLRRLKRPVTVVRYPGQGHGLTGWARTDLATRARTFIDACTRPR